ncbi:patatin-like phospholipase family protein [soil metagenome]
MHRAADIGLVMTGGGARAAYQVGVLDAIRHILDDRHALPVHSPFGVVSGTSAGAINAAAFACRADAFEQAVDRLVEVWSEFHADQVYRTEAIDALRSGGGLMTMLSAGWAFQRSRKTSMRSLFDNAPLEGLLQQLLDFPRLDRAIESGLLSALAITASDYSSGRHVTFYQSPEAISPWTRSQRIAVRESIGIDHLMASSAIPFLFPAIPLPLEGNRAWFGDGSMRQLAPLSPAIHLGAKRILVIGAGQLNSPDRFLPVAASAGIGAYPSIAQIAGHAMSSIFLDSLSMDIERLERINKTVDLIPPDIRRTASLRKIEVLVIAPSQRIDVIASRHIQDLPRSVRVLLRAIGATEAKGSALASYLLFEPGFTRELMQLGFDDTLGQRDNVVRFFGLNA